MMQNGQKLTDEQYNKVLFLNALWEYLSQWQGIFTSIREADPGQFTENIRAASDTLSEISRVSNELKFQVNDGHVSVAEEDQDKVNFITGSIQKIESQNGSLEQFARNLRNSVEKSLPEQSVSRGGVNLGNAQQAVARIDEQLENKLPLGETLKLALNDSKVNFSQSLTEFQGITNPGTTEQPVQPSVITSASSALTTDSVLDALSSNPVITDDNKLQPPRLRANPVITPDGNVSIIYEPIGSLPKTENALELAKAEVTRLEQQVNGIRAKGDEPDGALQLELGLAKNTVTILEKRIENNEPPISYDEAKLIANNQWNELINKNDQSPDNAIQQTEPMRAFLDAMEEQAQLIRKANPDWSEEQVQAKVKENWDAFVKGVTDQNAGSVFSPEAAAAQADGLAIDTPLRQADAEIDRLQKQLEAANINGNDAPDIQLEIALTKNARVAIEESIAKGNPISYDEARSKAQTDWDNHLRLNNPDQNNPAVSQPPLEVLIDNAVAQNVPAPSVAYAHSKLEEVKAELASYDAVGQLAPAELEQRRQIYESAYNDVVADPSKNFDQIVQGVYDYLGSLNNGGQSSAPAAIENPTTWNTPPADTTQPQGNNIQNNNEQMPDFTAFTATASDPIYSLINQQADFLAANARAVWDANTWMTPSQAVAQASVDFSRMLANNNPGDVTAQVNHNLDLQAQKTIDGNPSMDWKTARNEAQASFDQFVANNTGGGAGTPDPNVASAIPPASEEQYPPDTSWMNF